MNSQRDEDEIPLNYKDVSTYRSRPFRISFHRRILEICFLFKFIVSSVVPIERHDPNYSLGNRNDRPSYTFSSSPADLQVIQLSRVIGDSID